MQSVPLAGLKANLRPWEKLEWSLDQQNSIFKAWGIYFANKRSIENAVHYYNKAIDIKNNDYNGLCYRSHLKCKIADGESALTDIKTADARFRAVHHHDRNAQINLAMCEALYNLNQFENCKENLHDNIRKFQRSISDKFKERLVVVDENFNDSLGSSLTPFITENMKYFNIATESIKMSGNIDVRPLWKILKEQEKCDVVSLLEKEKVLLPPLEIARRRRALKLFSQNYLRKSWVDVLFLKALRNNSNLLLPQCKQSTPFLRTLAKGEYEKVKKFQKMLHAQSPMYNEIFIKRPMNSISDNYHEANLNRVQYQTRRNMFSVLRTLKSLREVGDCRKLIQFVESVMGNYVVLKTSRIMPWKFEFVNEVYNTAALALIERYKLPTKMFDQREKDRLVKLLNCMPQKSKERSAFVFGTKASSGDNVDSSFRAYKMHISRLEQRMLFTKHSIEKCYLWHEIAHHHLLQSRFDECCSAARNGLRETKLCSNYAWRFLCTMLVCKSHAILRKYEREAEELNLAYKIALKIKSPNLAAFIDICRSVNREDLVSRKHLQLDVTKKRRSKSSVSARSSLRSLQSQNGIMSKASF